MAINTPSMGLIKPDVGIEDGPLWATQINTSLDTLDAHDHSSGKGVKITPTGLNINSDLDIQTNDLTNVNHIRLSDTSGSGIDGVYQNSGNLYWRNTAGVDVQITAGNTINVGSLGTIGGDYSTDPNNPLITFTTATGNYDFFKDTVGSPIAGGINCGDITIFEETAGSNGISIISPSSLASAYTITLPPAQAATNNSLISVSAAGTWNYTRNPTANTIGFGAGLVSAPSSYSESDVLTGRYFPAVSQIADTLGGIQSFLQTQSQHTLFYNSVTGNRIGLAINNNGSSVSSLQIENSIGSADHIRIKNNNGRMYYEIDNTSEFYDWYIGAASQATLSTTGLSLGIAGNNNTHTIKCGRFFTPGDTNTGSLADPGTSLFAIGHRGANILLRQGENSGGVINPFRINSNMNFDGVDYIVNTGGIWGTQLAIGASGGSLNTPALEMLTSTSGTGSGVATTLGTNWRVTHAGATLGTDGSSSQATFGFLNAENSGMWRSSGGNLVFTRDGTDGYILSLSGIPRLTPAVDNGTNLGDPSFRWNNGYITTLNSTTINATSIPTVNATTVNATNVTATGTVQSATLNPTFAVTGVLQNGTFTPTITGGSLPNMIYARIGNRVIIAGTFNVSLDGAGSGGGTLTLPINTSFSSANDAAGTITNNGTAQGTFNAIPVSASIAWGVTGPSSTSVTVRFSGMYEIKNV